jgi:hypothetical protein
MSVITEVKIKTNTDITITDELNRKIVIRKPNRLAIVNYKIACGESAKYLEEEIFVLPWVQSIDDEKILSPTSLVNVKSLIQTLDNEGYLAVVNGITDYMKGEQGAGAQGKKANA